MDEPLLLTLTSPSLHFRWMGSFQQILLTRSPLNSDGRAPTIHIDEPFTALQTDGLLPTIYIDEPFAALQTDGLLPTIHIDEAHPSTQMDEPLLLTLTIPSLHFRWTGSFLQFILTRLIPQLKWTSPYYSQRRALHCTSNRWAPSYHLH